MKPMFLFAALLMTLSGLLAADNPAQLDFTYPTDAVPKPFGPAGQIYSTLTMEQTRKGIPDIRIVAKKEEVIEYVGEKSNLVDTTRWQESPSRIIFHKGKYHTIIMHVANNKPAGRAPMENIYVTSKDGYKWNVEGIVPNAAVGSLGDKWLEGTQIVKFDGKFYMFFSGVCKSAEMQKKYRGSIGLMVADGPEGPWKPAVKEPLLQPSEDPNAWDHDYLNNPYPVYFKGKWFIYYKAGNERFLGYTNGGVATADKITGPYHKYEHNPTHDCHGSWAWAYRGGITLFPFRGGKVHWSPDGLHFINVYTPVGNNGFKSSLFSAFYLPNDPLSGDPVTNVEPDVFWGLETRQYGPKPASERNWDLFRGTITFNPVKKAKNTSNGKVIGEEGQVVTP